MEPEQNRAGTRPRLTPSMFNAQTMQLFCLSDPRYYDTPERLADEAERYVLDTPAGWRRGGRGLWTEFRPAGDTLPDQGWKIHVAAVPTAAQSTVDIVADVCVPRRVPFKFLRSGRALNHVCGKYVDRGGSGKFATVYPADEHQLDELLAELEPALAGRAGPYVLSDLRVGAGPVYVRYGAFTERWCTGPDGTPVLAVRDPDGRLVPDPRTSTFTLPDWVRLPDSLRPHLAARGATDDAFPYRVERVLHTSNGGGTYLATDPTTGERVVLREARPYSGVDATGADAVIRLRREHEMLTRLAGLDCVPRVHGRRTLWEHEFLIEEYVPGETLLNAIVGTYPQRMRDPAPDLLAGYLRWVDRIIDELSQALDALHGRGVCHGDVHPSNVMIRPDGSVVLLDFEYAGEATARRDVRVGAAGFAAPGSVTGIEADRYALRSTRLMALLPLAEMVGHDPGKVTTLEAVAQQFFGLPTSAAGPAPPVGSGEPAVAALFDDPARHWPEIRDRLSAGILAAATPQRLDRLFPGHPEQFDGQGATLAYGAAGVLVALHRAGVTVPAGHVDWLVAAGERITRRAGLFDGLAGVAVALAELGRRDEALAALARCRELPAPVTLELHAGLAGVAWARCRFAGLTGDDDHVAEALRIAADLDAMVTDGGPGLPGTAGLSTGMSGAALVQLWLYRRTGDERHLAACRRALGHDLGYCVPMEDGTVLVKNGHRHVPYLDAGSGGIALVASGYLRHRDDDELAAFVPAVRRACGHPMVREPGLFTGRAGLLAVLARLGGSRDEVLAQVRRLAWHAVYRDGHLLIPGRWLYRFSADLATGSAGVLAALTQVLGR
jgi:aminoglycoside phosphotransferase